jgi:hypothetical protein
VSTTSKSLRPWSQGRGLDRRQARRLRRRIARQISAALSGAHVTINLKPSKEHP